MEDLPDVLWPRRGLGLHITVQQRNGLFNFIFLERNFQSVFKDCVLMTIYVLMSACGSLLFGAFTSTIR